MKALIFDIEGTTTDINFVHNILFPYAKKNIELYVRNNQSKIETILSSIKINYSVDSLNEIIVLLKQWIEEDKKIKELKDLQGLIWDEGYAKGEFTAHLYDDVLPNLKKWKEAGFMLYIYSSGSIKAQKLLFSHTKSGDITHFFSGYFDTGIGSKKESSSYTNISREIDIPPEDITFFTDSVDEAVAAVSASLNIIHVNRDGLYNDSTYQVVKSFSDVGIINE